MQTRPRAQSVGHYRWRSQEGSETDDFPEHDLTNHRIADVTLTTPNPVYMQTRHYDPALGRFLMADSIPMGAFSPQGLNCYTYCLNDPVNLTDANGEGWGWFDYGYTMGAIIGVTDAVAKNTSPKCMAFKLFAGSIAWALKNSVMSATSFAKSKASGCLLKMIPPSHAITAFGIGMSVGYYMGVLSVELTLTAWAVGSALF